MTKDIKGKILLKNIKENDVFHATWKQKEWGDQKDWCFEGLIVAKKVDGKMMFIDTYWGVGREDNKKWDYTNFNKLFNFNYYCNLTDLEKIKSYDAEYYDDKDVFVLHDQHSCVESCRYYYIRKGSKRSKSKMLEVLEEKLSEAKRNVEYATRSVEEYATKKQQVEDGNLDIYI